MEAKEVLEIVLREVDHYGDAYRTSWSDFDGRTLRYQLDGLIKFAHTALSSSEKIEFSKGAEFLKRTRIYCGIEVEG